MLYNLPASGIKNPAKLRDILLQDEGQRSFPYTDTTGHLTIGVGHNLSAKGVSQRIQDLLLEEDIEDAVVVLNRLLPSWPLLDEVRQVVFISLAFNLGNRLGKFLRLLKSAKEGLWGTAARELEDSLWFRQVKLRGPRLVRMLRTGTYE